MTAYTATSGASLAPIGEALGAAGAVVLALGIALRLPLAIPWAVALTAAGYVVVREQRSTVDGWAAVVGALLLLAAELAAWAIEHDARIHEERTIVVRRALTIAALVASSALAGFVLVGAAAFSTSTGVLLTAVGVAAAVAAVAVILRLART